MLLSSLVLATIGNMYSNFLWLGTSLLGLGLASFYASTITWVERYVNVTNKVGSSFVVAASFNKTQCKREVSLSFSRTLPLREFSMKLCLMAVLMMFVAVLATSIADDDHDYADADDGEDEIPYKKKDTVPRWKRPWDLQIRVP
ncbi:sodium-dependent glucose transporter 1A [Caerostris extrusa]|uniref:Sodium-dependent glucose transporter 1A n=1 Tax=Caerostris extrusa TaxID=172846 RepID=A0AAV4VJJ2_CAEEX|nr:sodium-dependent glucose transporter 1A [Caerostris extrusa]